MIHVDRQTERYAYSHSGFSVHTHNALFSLNTQDKIKLQRIQGIVCTHGRYLYGTGHVVFPGLAVWPHFTRTHTQTRKRRQPFFATVKREREGYKQTYTHKFTTTHHCNNLLNAKTTLPTYGPSVRKKIKSVAQISSAVSDYRSV